MNKKIIKTDTAPAPVGMYNQGIVWNELIITAGQIPLNPEDGSYHNEDIVGATRQVIKNVIAVVEAGGGSKDSILKMTVFMQDLNDFASVNTVFSEFFQEKEAPARSAVQVVRLPKDALIEIEAMAVKVKTA
ncbi:Rid family detoxifying hydrolase [bacterium]|nr:Rid family detoxifying hydrolase [bacterium]